MKKILISLLPLIAATAMADNERIKGEIQTVIFKPEVKVIVKTAVGHETINLGPAEAWRGMTHWLDRRDTIEVVGERDEANDFIMADRMWLNGTYFILPKFHETRR